MSSPVRCRSAGSPWGDVQERLEPAVGQAACVADQGLPRGKASYEVLYDALSTAPEDPRMCMCY